MAAPKIKLYRLKRDFTVDSLSRDRKSEVDDEILPVFDKYVAPEDIISNRSATGVLPSEGRVVEKLCPITDRITANLILQEVSNSISISKSGSDSVSSNSLSLSTSGELNSGLYAIELNSTDSSTYGNLNINLCLNDGVYPVVLIGTTKVPKSGWTVVEKDGNTYIQALGRYCYSTFTTISFSHITNSVSTLYCSSHAPIYDGGNSYFKPFIFTIKDEFDIRYKDNIVDGITYISNHDSEMVFYDRATSASLEDGDYYINKNTGEVKISDNMMNNLNGKDVCISYVYLAFDGEIYRNTKRFVAEFVNIVPQNDEDAASGGHLFMGPDVFLGKKQYEPSSYEDADTGEVITIGIIPAYVEPGNYTIYHRNGYVVFPAKVNSSPEFNTADYAWNSDNLSYTKDGTYTKIGGSVHISHAHVCCIENVNNQIFEKYYSYEDLRGSNSISTSDIVSGLRPGDVVFKASSIDKRYLDSIGAPWVKRNTTYMPIKVYVTYKEYSNSRSDSGYNVVTETKPQVITIPNYDELTVKTL